VKSKCIFYTLIMSIFVLSSCSEFFTTPDDMRGEKLGLRSIEYQDSLLFEPEYQEVEISHRARVSSRRYEARIYFPSFTPSESRTLWDERQELAKVLEGLEARFVDVSTGQILQSVSFKPSTGMSINDSPGKPSSIWLFSKLKLKKGKNYRLELKIPPKREYPKEYYNALLVIGIGSTPML
jgi:hypothetical protein